MINCHCYFLCSTICGLFCQKLAITAIRGRNKLEINIEYLLRLGLVICILFHMLLWERIAPKRKSLGIKWQRRFNNLLLVVCGTFLLWLIIPITAVWASIVAAESYWGLFNIYHLPKSLELILSLLFLDLLIYGQHVVLHKVPVLWRLHRVHHTDMDFDATTGIRFHPIELILSMCVKIVGIIFIGAPLSAVIIFEIILNGSSMFNHGNVSIPKKVDRIMRWFIVTPDMHRVHHSAIKKETNSNYGFNLPWWDRLFGTYCAQPEAGHLEMKIGLNEFSGERTVNFLWLLMQPFLRTENYQKILR